jgi:hypothetical protein
MIDLHDFVAALRAAGIKSLALELSESGGAATVPAGRDDWGAWDPKNHPPAPELLGIDRTEKPPAEPKDPSLCQMPDCGAPAGGIFGGVAHQLCRTHAMQKAGVKT